MVAYFSDQGWMGGQNGIGGMGDHFHPIGAHELMMQISPIDLLRDPRERFNLSGQPGIEDTRAGLAGRLDAFFAEHADPRDDIWKGGRSKAKRHAE